MIRFIFFILIFSSGQCLNKFLKHYEPLNYEAIDLSHVSRSTNKTIRLNFHAYGRDFELILDRIKKKDSVFMEGATIEIANETTKIDEGSNMYQGTINDDDNSQVLGSIRGGIFEGMIRVSDGEEFWVESSLPYKSNASFHSFIYSINEIEMPKPQGRTKRAQNVNLRPERSASMDGNGARSNRLCNVFVEVDHTLYDWVKAQYQTDSIAQTKQQVKDIINPLFHHVNNIFESIDFGEIRGIRFKPAVFKIWHDKGQRGYPFKDETRDSDKFLRWYSAQNHEKYCLAYVFTFRDFDKATQGLAYTCRICSTRDNTGMITFRSRGNNIPAAQWPLTLAHELGHSMGSGHDELPVRSGKSEEEEHPECKHHEGRFIMYKFSNNGRQKNHQKFSPCSIRNITRNLKRFFTLKTRRTKDDQQSNCLTASDTPICGNGITEQNEICDCGWTQDECNEIDEKCCWPGNSKHACTLKDPTYDCSPTQGTCCDDTCRYRRRGEICHKKNECQADSRCGGRHAACPEQEPINEGKLCEDVSGVCTDGECAGSVCAAEGMEQCSTAARTCIVHCQGADGVCRSTASLSQFTSSTNYSQHGRWGHPGVMMRPNDICLDGLGFCSKEDQCRDAVHERAESAGRAHGGITTFGEFLVEKWWILILILVVAILILLLSVLLCFYKIPTKLDMRTDVMEIDTHTSKSLVATASKVELQTDSKAEQKVDSKVEQKANSIAVKPKSKSLKVNPAAKPETPSTRGNWTSITRWTSKKSERKLEN